MHKLELQESFSTVVDLGNIIDEGLDIFIEKLQEKAELNEYLNELQQEDKYEEVKEALNVGKYNNLLLIICFYVIFIL